MGRRRRGADVDRQVLESAPRIPADAICYICRNDGSAQGLVSGCGCHGGAGIAHVTCLAGMAQMDTKETMETGCGKRMGKWTRCYLCSVEYHGHVKLALGRACWKTYEAC